MDDPHLNTEQSHPQSSHPSDVDSFVSRLRDDLLPGSEVEPDQENVKHILARIDYQKIIKIIGLVFGIAIITILVFKMGIFLSNNTRQITEKSSPTMIVEKTPINESQPMKPLSDISTKINTQIPFPSATLTYQPPSLTPTIIRASNTPIPLPTKTQTLTPTVGSVCLDALSITQNDIGKVVCIQGIILNTVDNPNGFLIAFGNRPRDFYLVSYDMVWAGAESGDCIQVTGRIDQIGNSPVMLFGWNNLPQLCP